MVTTTQNCTVVAAVIPSLLCIGFFAEKPNAPLREGGSLWGAWFNCVKKNQTRLLRCPLYGVVARIFAVNRKFFSPSTK